MHRAPALIVVLAVGLAACGSGATSSPATTSSAATASPSSTSSAAPTSSVVPAAGGPLDTITLDELRWREVDVAFPAGIRDAQGGFAGTPTDGGVTLLTRSPVPRLVTCLTGSACETRELDLGTDAAAYLVGRTDDALWLAGAHEELPAIWSSPDGVTWEEHRLAPSERTAEALVTVTDLMAGKDALLALGPGMVTSPSGEPPGRAPLFAWTWSQGAFLPVDEPHPALTDATMASVVSGRPSTLVADNDGFLAGAPAGPMSQFGPGATVFYRSVNGAHWRGEPARPTPPLHINDLASSGAAYLAEASLDGIESVWIATDLAHWEEAAIPAETLGVDCGPSGCAILGVEDGTVSLWHSTDGLTWNEADPIIELDDGQSMGSRGFVVGDGVVAVWGQITGPDEIAQPQLWVGEVVHDDETRAGIFERTEATANELEATIVWDVDESWMTLGPEWALMVFWEEQAGSELCHVASFEFIAAQPGGVRGPTGLIGPGNTVHVGIGPSDADMSDAAPGILALEVPPFPLATRLAEPAVLDLVVGEGNRATRTLDPATIVLEWRAAD